jgi:flagellar secretion chaperone FliS
MRTNGYKNYLEHEVLEAQPVKLVQLLYRGALDSIASARRHLREGDIRARSQSITKAMLIVTELSLSLNAEHAGDLSRRLRDLYGYVQKLLIKANFAQREPPLIEAERLLFTLHEAWTECRASEPERDIQVSEQPESHEDYKPVACCY